MQGKIIIAVAMALLLSACGENATMKEKTSETAKQLSLIHI